MKRAAGTRRCEVSLEILRSQCTRKPPAVNRGTNRSSLYGRHPHESEGWDGAFCALPPDQITIFLSNGYSTNDRVLAWCRKYTSGFTYRSAYCTAVTYDDSKSPDVNASTRPPLRAADCASELCLSEPTNSRSLRYWSERKLLRIDESGAIRLNGTVPSNSDKPAAKTNAPWPQSLLPTETPSPAIQR